MLQIIWPFLSVTLQEGTAWSSTRAMLEARHLLDFQRDLAVLEES